MIQKSPLFLSLLLIGFSSFAEEKTYSQPRENSVEQSLEFPDDIPTSINDEMWIYKVYKNILFDVDQSIEESGIQIEFCTYKNLNTNASTSYKKVGNCLFSHFIDSMKTKREMGVIYFWMRDSKKRLVPIRVDWRPTEEGWRGVFKELMALKFESFSQFWIRIRRSSSEVMEPTNFKQNFLGRIVLHFPPGTTLTDTFLEKNAINSIFKFDKAQEISFEMNPVGKKNGEVHYRGRIVVSQEMRSVANSTILIIDFSTNMNLLKSDRPYRVQGKLGPAEPSKQEGVLP